MALVDSGMGEAITRQSSRVADAIMARTIAWLASWGQRRALCLPLRRQSSPPRTDLRYRSGQRPDMQIAMLTLMRKQIAPRFLRFADRVNKLYAAADTSAVQG